MGEPTTWDMLNDLFNAPKPKTYTLYAGDLLIKALARHEWKERYRAQRVLSRPAKFLKRPI